MKTEELISQLDRLDVRLWSEGDRLRYSAPTGAIGPALRAELVRHKQEILALLHEARKTADSPAPPLVAVSRDQELPLSFAQQRLWFVAELEPESPVYNLPGAERLEGVVDVAALGASLNEIVRRHEVLRTTFASINGRPVPRIAPHLEVPLPVVDLSRLPEAVREAGARRLAAEEAQRPFDLAAGPLIRMTLVRLRRADGVVLVTMHHIVADLWSMGVFRRELLAHYRHAPAASRSPLRLPGSPSCRCSTPITLTGSGDGWPARCWNASSRTGATGSPARRGASSCPPTVRARRARASGARGSRSRSRPNGPPPSPSWAGEATRRSS